MKHILFSLFLLGAANISLAANITISGHLDNTLGAAINVDLSLNDGGTIINQSSSTDPMGDFSVSVNVSTSQGLIDMSFVDCNGATQTANTSWYPNSVVDFGAIDYCPPSSGTCVSGFTIAQAIQGNIPVANLLIVTNTSTGAGLTYTWDFGDGNTATGMTLSHTYTSPGPFNLCLTVDNGNGCVDTFCDSIGVNAAGWSLGKQLGFTINMVGIASLDESNVDYAVNIFPNPAIGNVSIELENISEVMTLKLFNLSGQEVLSQVVEASSGSQTINVELSSIPSGVYLINLANSRGAINKRIIVK